MPSSLRRLRYQAMPLQYAADGASRRERTLKLSLQFALELLWTPARVLLPHSENRRHDLACRAMGNAPWCSTLVFQADRTQHLIAAPELVSRLSGHPVLATQVGHPFSALQATYKFDS
jgi:hypothetical protein